MSLDAPRVLAIDDHADNLIALAAVVRDALLGAEVATASSGPRGLELAHVWDPDVILLDVVMPDMDGFAVCRALKADPLLREIPVVFLTALGSEPMTRVKALEVGAEGFAGKPWDEAELVAQIRAMTKIKAAHRAERVERDELARLVAARTQDLEAELTERCRAEATLRASEAKFRTLFNSSADAIVVYTHVPGQPPGRMVEANEEACRRYGYTRDELLQRCPTDLDAPGGAAALAAGLEQLARHGHARWEGRHHARDGRPIDVEINHVVFSLGQEELVLATFRDISERRRLEAQIAQADRLAAAGTIAAGVGHEINNPLTYVIYNVESLARDVTSLVGAVERCAAALREQLGPERFAAVVGEGVPLLEPAVLHDVAERAREALDGALRIKSVTRSLSSLARDESPELCAVDLRQPIEAAVRIASSELKHRARLVLSLGVVPEVLASEGRLAQVFLNLVLNAAHAIEEGHVDDHRIEIRTFSEGERVFVEVSDTGSGIAPEHLGRLFEPFFTTKGVGKGSGLGLPICRSILAGFGGDIEIASQVGVGTRVRVGLRPSREVVSSPLPPPVSGARAVRGRVLVVDDEEAIRKALSRLLRREHEVLAAASGAEGRAILEGDQGFDVILCDLMMDDMTGMDLHAWLAEAYPALAERTVFLTGGAFTPKAASYLAEVTNPKIDKPFDTAALCRYVTELVAKVKLVGHAPDAEGAERGPLGAAR